MREHVLSLPEGRRIQVREDGDPLGFPVFVLHGNPGSRLLYDRHVDDARAKRIRLIGYDRPGYGGSTAQRGRRIADAAHDVRRIADHLSLGRFGVWGHSAGGPPALACAALLSDRLVGASCLAPHAPYPAEGLDWPAGMGEFNQLDFRLMLEDPAAWEAKTERDRKEMLAAAPDSLVSMLASLLPEVDRAAWTPELADYLDRELHEGLRPGSEGTRDDSLSTVLDWGFDLGSIRVPVQIWHGGQDRFAPQAHGRWLAARVPGVVTHFEPAEGHVSLLARRIPEVHDWLLEQA